MRILLSALEPSSNLHFSEIKKYLNKDIELVGIFDEKFGNPLYSSKDFSVMGITDVIPKLFKGYEAIKELGFLSKDCQKVLLIDAPAFNLPLAKEIKKNNPNIEIIYYILPKVWAWKKNRIKKIEKYCDKIISIFPFENKFYNNPLYFGNPLMDEIKEFKNKVTNYDKIAFLAGSRKSEIKSLMPIYKELSKKIDKKLELVIPPHFNQDEIDKLYGDISSFIISRDTHKTLLNSDFAFICSGTATLEASLIGIPFILTYITKPLDFWIATKFIKLPYAGLANIILNFLDKEVLHIELLQNDATVKNLFKYYLKVDREKFFNNSKQLRDILKGNCSENIAKLLNL